MVQVLGENVSSGPAEWRQEIVDLMVQVVLENARWVNRGTKAADAGRDFAAYELCWSVVSDLSLFPRSVVNTESSRWAHCLFDVG